MGLSNLLYGPYERRLMASLDRSRIPRHVGVILDGNRRWAALQGGSTAQGHRAGADKIIEFLGWCEEAGVEVATLWLLSTDNLARPAGELDPLLGIIESTVRSLATQGHWRVQEGRGRHRRLRRPARQRGRRLRRAS